MKVSISVSLARPAAFLPALLLAAIALAGCTGRAEGVLVPLGVQPPGVSAVDMVVATTRADQGAAPGEMFSGERGIGLNFAEIRISIPPDSVRKAGEVQWPSRLPPDPAREFATISAERLDQPQVMQRFQARLARTPHRSVLIFVHGYNTRFEEA
ncbi:MAG: alpha/beta hydrolase, partial [Alphaproteobacteria bacterium]|nr:alpha/beta hydrolase [Alphaproteobacteria bacterium]